MPSTAFTTTMIYPAALSGITIKPNEDAIIELTCPEDPANIGTAVLVPDLNTLRQAGSQLIKQYNNVAALMDGNGVVSTGNLPNLTGGFAALRAYSTATGAQVFQAGLIPCAISFVTGYDTSPINLIANNNKVRLRYDPRPNNSTTALLDANYSYELLFSEYLPSVSADNTVEIEGGDGGGGGV